MSLTAIINLAERLLNNASDQPVDVISKQSRQAARPELDAKDHFTPSAANQQDAGLFQVRQVSVFSVAAEFLLAHTAQSQDKPAAASPVTANAAAAPAAAQQAPTNVQIAAQALVAAAP